jgi:uncharacterized protein YegP (UPF0339 family)
MATNRNRWEFYKDNKGEHRWRKIAANNEVVGASSEGFKSLQGAKKNARLMGYRGS